MELIAFLQPLVLTSILGGLLGSIAAAVWWYTGAERLRRLPPAVRLRRLLTLAALPVLSAVASVGVVLLPSMLHLAGVAADHCHTHASHHLHLCFVHPHLAHAHTLGWLVVGIFAVWLGLRTSGVLGSWIRANRQLQTLREADTADAKQTVQIVSSERPFAATVGFLAPRVVLTSSLRRALSDDQLRVVRAHEEAHARRRHPLLKSLVDLVGLLHAPRVRRFLNEETKLACEQVADREAARRVDGRVDVADTVLDVHKLSTGTRGTTPLQTAMDGSDLERRVVGLLDQPWDASLPWTGVVATIVPAAIVSFSPDGIHHGVETLFSFVF